MNDREMLEYAAKAAGYEVEGYDEKYNMLRVYDPRSGTGGNAFAPLARDGDALRLAVRLNLAVHKAFCYTPTGKLFSFTDNANTLAATRRAIVRAAAEIGKGVK